MGAGSFTNHPARLAAIAIGENCFNPGEPCAHGHSVARYVSTGACLECQRLKRTEGQRVEAPKRGRPKTRATKRPNGFDVLKAPQPDAAAIKVDRPKVFRALDAYHNSADAHARSKHLNNLIRKIA